MRYSYSYVLLQWTNLKIGFAPGKKPDFLPYELLFLGDYPQFSNAGIKNRGTETEEQIQKRLRNAEAEIKAGKSSGIFGHILYNDNLEECYKNLKVNLYAFCYEQIIS